MHRFECMILSWTRMIPAFEPRRARTTSYLFPSAHRGVMMTSIMPAEISLTNSSIHLTDYVRSVPWSGMRLIGTPWSRSPISLQIRPILLFRLFCVFIVWVVNSGNRTFLKKEKSPRFRLFSDVSFWGIQSSRRIQTTEHMLKCRRSVIFYYNTIKNTIKRVNHRWGKLRKSPVITC